MVSRVKHVLSVFTKRSSLIIGVLLIATLLLATGNGNVGQFLQTSDETSKVDPSATGSTLETEPVQFSDAEHAAIQSSFNNLKLLRHQTRLPTDSASLEEIAFSPYHENQFTAVKNILKSKEADTRLEQAVQLVADATSDDARAAEPLPPAEYESPSAAISTLAEQRNTDLTAADRSFLTELDNTPPPVRNRLTQFLNAFIALDAAVNQAYDDVNISEMRSHLETLQQRSVSDASEKEALKALNSIDFAVVLATRNQFLETLPPLQRVLAENGPISHSTSSNAYKIPPVLAMDLQGQDGMYTKDYSLILDAGGGDTYHNNAGGGNIGLTTTAAAIDFGSGSDTYGDLDNPQCCGVNGGGAVGSGLLLDAGGGDTYAADREGVNGGAYWGVGLLLDLAGSDTYRGKRAGVNGGSTTAGNGFLIDFSGDDTYLARDGGVNGGGYLGGSGSLLDVSGDDTYRANVDPFATTNTVAYSGGEEDTTVRTATGVADAPDNDDGNGDDGDPAPETGGRNGGSSTIAGVGSGGGLLVDVSGEDLYEDSSLPPRSCTDCVMLPKPLPGGLGVQLDTTPLLEADPQISLGNPTVVFRDNFEWCDGDQCSLAEADPQVYEPPQGGVENVYSPAPMYEGVMNYQYTVEGSGAEFWYVNGSGTFSGRSDVASLQTVEDPDHPPGWQVLEDFSSSTVDAEYEQTDAAFKSRTDWYAAGTSHDGTNACDINQGDTLTAFYTTSKNNEISDDSYQISGGVLDGSVNEKEFGGIVSSFTAADRGKAIELGTTFSCRINPSGSGAFNTLSNLDASQCLLHPSDGSSNPPPTGYAIGFTEDNTFAITALSRSSFSWVRANSIYPQTANGCWDSTDQYCSGRDTNNYCIEWKCRLNNDWCDFRDDYIRMETLDAVDISESELDSEWYTVKGTWTETGLDATLYNEKGEIVTGNTDFSYSGTHPTVSTNEVSTGSDGVRIGGIGFNGSNPEIDDFQVRENGKLTLELTLPYQNVIGAWNPVYTLRFDYRTDTHSTNRFTFDVKNQLYQYHDCIDKEYKNTGGEWVSFNPSTTVLNEDVAVDEQQVASVGRSECARLTPGENEITFRFEQETDTSGSPAVDLDNLEVTMHTAKLQDVSPGTE